MHGVPAAGEALYAAGPVARTRRGEQVGRHENHADVVNLGLGSGIAPWRVLRHLGLAPELSFADDPALLLFI